MFASTLAAGESGGLPAMIASDGADSSWKTRPIEIKTVGPNTFLKDILSSKKIRYVLDEIDATMVLTRIPVSQEVSNQNGDGLVQLSMVSLQQDVCSIKLCKLLELLRIH